VVLLLILTLLNVSQHVNASIEPLNYDRVHLVDANSAMGTFLFRGNQPELNNTFAYTTLKTYLTQRAQEEGGIKLPDLYYLYDISLLSVNNSDEVAALQVEIDYMKQNPSLGYLLNWPLQGDVLGPYNYSIINREYLATTLPAWQPDQLAAKVKFIKSLLTRQTKVTDLPLVVYVHCGHGQDRTGEMTGAYELQYNLKTFQEIWSYDTGMGMDVVENEHSLQWYCLYYADTNGKSSSFCDVEAKMYLLQ